MKSCIQIMNGFMALWKTFYKDILYNMIHTEYYKDGTPCECDKMRREYHFSGFLEAEAPIVSGKMHGTRKTYYESGALETICLFKNGKEHGTTKVFYESGALEQEIPCAKGKMHGIQKGYKESGELAFAYMYIHGNYLPKGICPMENYV